MNSNSGERAAVMVIGKTDGLEGPQDGVERAASVPAEPGGQPAEPRSQPAEPRGHPAEPGGQPAEPDASSPEPAIRAVGLVKRFGPVAAVDGMTFDLAPGRIYGLLGPNGSGKTTLIRLLTGMTKATEGHAEVLGVRMPSRANLVRIGYMTQSDGIYPALTAAENARFFAAAYGVRDDTAVTEALALVGLGDRSRIIAATLSGGQRRLLSLACALVHHPPVLFLDEPTVGVDPLLRVQFWTHFRDLADAGATIVVSSHVMDEADRCDELLFMRAGRMIARGSREDLRAQSGTDDLEAAFLVFVGAGEVAA